MRLFLQVVNFPWRFRYSCSVGHSTCRYLSGAAPTRPWRVSYPSRRTYASAAAAQFTEEIVEVPVGGNGFVSLR
jgi:hypothetical protein